MFSYNRLFPKLIPFTYFRFFGSQSREGLGLGNLQSTLPWEDLGLKNRLYLGYQKSNRIRKLTRPREGLSLGNRLVLGRASASEIGKQLDLGHQLHLGNRLCHPLILIISKSGDFDRRCSWRWGTQSTTLDAGRRGGTSNVAKLKRR